MSNTKELCVRLTRGATAVLVLCALGMGQDGPSTGVEFTKKIGVKDVNGQLRLYGKAGVKTMGEGDANFREQFTDESRGKKFEAAAGAALDVEFLGKLREALALQVKYELSLAGTQGRARSNAVASAEEAQGRKLPGEIKKEIRLCGFTIELQDDGGKAKTAPKNLVPGGVTAQFMVGPVPLLVRANAGVGMDIGLAPFSGRDDSEVGLEATAGAYCNGWVVAGVGGGCRFASVCAGVKADLRLVDFVKTARLGVDVDTLHPVLRLSYELTPAALKLSLIAYAELCVGFAKISRKFEHLVWQWSAPAIAADITPIGS